MGDAAVNFELRALPPNSRITPTTIQDEWRRTSRAGTNGRVEAPGAADYHRGNNGEGFMAGMLRAASFALLALSFIQPASAQDYPARQVRIIVPFGAGGPADILCARLLAHHLSGSSSKTFINREPPGAGSIIGTDAPVAKSRLTATRSC